MRELEAEVRRDVERIFEEKTRRLGVDAKLDLHVVRSVWGPPVVGENVYAEAFPLERPPRVWMEVFVPDATTEEITKTICHELIHLQHPELGEQSREFKKRVRACVEGGSEEERTKDILRRAGYQL